MKKLFVIAIAACATTLVLASCGNNTAPSSNSSSVPPSSSTASSSSASSSSVTTTGTPLAEAVSGKQKEVLDASSDLKPIAIGCVKYDEGGASDGNISGDEAVNALRDYLNSITIGAKSDIMYSDAETIYYFYLPDGTEVGFDFMPGQMEINGEWYLITANKKLDLDFFEE